MGVYIHLLTRFKDAPKKKALSLIIPEPALCPVHTKVPLRSPICGVLYYMCMPL